MEIPDLHAHFPPPHPTLGVGRDQAWSGSPDVWGRRRRGERTGWKECLGQAWLSWLVEHGPRAGAHLGDTCPLSTTSCWPT